ncbi:hypothetical protein EVAR_35309_1 [Eumeta japonica]|uniref:Uncharacterized protein n=1 Tax=Eumeta variegata TaxID=151549 RepID=A0A4C1XMB1_EUMVA|nr:hypothetical protein EVAR_35309_1 [Eumeta japonica]
MPNARHALGGTGESFNLTHELVSRVAVVGREPDTFYCGAVLTADPASFRLPFRCSRMSPWPGRVQHPCYSDRDSRVAAPKCAEENFSWASAFSANEGVIFQRTPSPTPAPPPPPPFRSSFNVQSFTITRCRESAIILYN